jgi:FkbM family methyltransferase
LPIELKIFPVAISDRTGHANFALDRHNLGNGRIVSELSDLSVKMVTGDQLLESIQKIDLIKIDVQGHEAKVIESMRMTIIRVRIRWAPPGDRG